MILCSFHKVNPKISGNPVVVRHVTHQLWALHGPARRKTNLLTSFSHILIKIKTICIQVFSENRFCWYIKSCEIFDNPITVRHVDHGLCMVQHTGALKL